MGVIVDETELSCSIAPARFFKASLLENTLWPKAVPTFFKSVEYIQGNGEVGSIKLLTYYEDGKVKTVKHKIEEVDEAELVYTFSVVEGLNLGETFESVRSVHKAEAGPNGGCVMKVTNTYVTKGGNDAVIEEGIKKAKADRVVAFFNAAAAYLHANPNEYN